MPGSGCWGWCHDCLLPCCVHQDSWYERKSTQLRGMYNRVCLRDINIRISGNCFRLCQFRKPPWCPMSATPVIRQSGGEYPPVLQFCRHLRNSRHIRQEESGRKDKNIVLRYLEYIYDALLYLIRLELVQATLHSWDVVRMTNIPPVIDLQTS